MERSLTTTWSRALLPLGLAASVAGNALAQQPGVAPAWSVTNLGTLDGARTVFTDFNNHGQVVGTAYPGFPDSPARRAFLYDAGRMTAIPPLPGLRFNEGLGINDRGQVIGSAWDVGVQRGFLYSGGQLTPLVLPGSITTRPVGINGRGDVLLGGARLPTTTQATSIATAPTTTSARSADPPRPLLHQRPRSGDGHKHSLPTGRSRASSTAKAAWSRWRPPARRFFPVRAQQCRPSSRLLQRLGGDLSRGPDHLARESGW